MGKIAKVGIYKDTSNQMNYVLAIKADHTTYYFDVSYNDFLRGWFSEAPTDPAKPQRYCLYAKQYGVVSFLQSKADKPLHPYLTEALLGFQITPTLFTRCGKTNPKRLKWVPRRKGGWGGARR